MVSKYLETLKSKRALVWPCCKSGNNHSSEGRNSFQMSQNLEVVTVGEIGLYYVVVVLRTGLLFLFRKCTPFKITKKASFSITHHWGRKSCCHKNYPIGAYENLMIRLQDSGKVAYKSVSR